MEKPTVLAYGRLLVDKLSNQNDRVNKALLVLLVLLLVFGTVPIIAQFRNWVAALTDSWKKTALGLYAGWGWLLLLASLGWLFWAGYSAWKDSEHLRLAAEQKASEKPMGATFLRMTGGGTAKLAETTMKGGQTFADLSGASRMEAEKTVFEPESDKKDSSDATP